MLRFFMFGSIVLAMGSAFFLYATNYQTGRIDSDVKIKERHKAKLIGDISVLKAERAYLARPERIARHASELGLRPSRGDQFVDGQKSVERGGER